MVPQPFKYSPPYLNDLVGTYMYIWLCTPPLHLCITFGHMHSYICIAVAHICAVVALVHI